MATWARIISFRVGVEDAKLLAREFYPTFSETDLVNLPNHSIYLKLLIDGEPSQAFSAVTLPPTARRQAYQDRKSSTASRKKYAKTKAGSGTGDSVFGPGSAAGEQSPSRRRLV